MSDSGFFLLPTNKLYKKRILESLKMFLWGMWEVFIEIWQTTSILAQIFIRE